MAHLCGNIASQTPGAMPPIRTSPGGQGASKSSIFVHSTGQSSFKVLPPVNLRRSPPKRGGMLCFRWFLKESQMDCPICFCGSPIFFGTSGGALPSKPVIPTDLTVSLSRNQAPFVYYRPGVPNPHAPNWRKSTQCKNQTVEAQ